MALATESIIYYYLWVAVIYVTVQAKTSLVHTSTLVLYNFCWVRSTDFKFTGLVEQTSLYHC